MSSPTPRKKINEIIQSINEMIVNGRNHERIEEIIIEANKMKAYGQYTDACIVLGVVAALRSDFNEVDRLFKAAFAHSGRTVDTLLKYAVVLSNLHRHIDAVKIIDELMELVPDDLFVVNNAFLYHFTAFDVDGARKLMSHMKLLSQPIDEAMWEERLIWLEEIMKEHKVVWKDVASRIELASRALRQSGMVPRSADRFEWDGIMIYKFFIQGDVDSICLAESAMIDAIANQPYSPVDDFLYFSCESV
ncbi:hypothetical protein [Candidatus Nitrotoga fabula]|uniref:Uncharacterized protein n=1 Tax=Candidatus Nitrotoga fabula TaxID=2182327 RepID=A0A916BEA6_9PROT|nr:hypothetical protein [Candidatus Nitrotoga fabula]CAE6723441.1 hypothetical protein NTGZN8_330016 [Candidatus Nitrotoga fabula]